MQTELVDYVVKEGGGGVSNSVIQTNCTAIGDLARSTEEVREKYERSTREVREKYERSTREVREKYGRSTGEVREKYGRSTGEVRDNDSVVLGLNL